MNKKGQSAFITVVIGLVVVLIVGVIVGSVENAQTFTQSLTSTIGDYLEPLRFNHGNSIRGISSCG